MHSLCGSKNPTVICTSTLAHTQARRYKLTEEQKRVRIHSQKHASASTHYTRSHTRTQKPVEDEEWRIRMKGIVKEATDRRTRQHPNSHHHVRHGPNDLERGGRGARGGRGGEGGMRWSG